MALKKPRPKGGASPRRPKVERSSPPVAGNRGASLQKSRFSGRWRAWVGHHQHSAVDSLYRLLNSPLQSLMTWLVLAVALALPATLVTALDNLQSIGQRWDGVPKVTLFLHVRARPAAIEKLQQQLESRPQFASVIYVSPEKALAEFEAEAGMGSALRSLDQNPLPPALVLTPLTDLSIDELRTLVAELEQQAIVDEALYDRAWIERLNQILALGEQLVMALGLLFAVGVLLVVGNTIRLAIEARRDEIVIIKLVGGSDAFVRRPFLYTGLWYGLGGAVIAWLIISLAMSWLAEPVAQLAALYGSDFRLLGLGVSGSLQLLLTGVLIGWLGAWLAVGRHLGDIKPQ